MSWFTNLAQAYDRITDITKDMLLPIYHMESKTDICVTIDGDGKFLHAELSDLIIKIPCTEDSSTRTNPCPHPLHDQLSYLAIDLSKRKMYLSQLEAWKSGHPKIEAVYSYINNGSLLDDLSSLTLKEPKDKLFIRFCVEIPGDKSPKLWEDDSIAEAWQTYCSTLETDKKTLCYVTGRLAQPVEKHPKGINMSSYGAKLISCNDETNYTYRGRFTKPYQANSIGIEASHKAHSMLKNLIATQKNKCDTQAIVAWTLEDGSTQPDPLEDSLNIYSVIVKTKTDDLINAQSEIGTDYAINMRNALRGIGSADKLKNQIRRIAVMAVDAATTGRMGITFYQDLQENEYIERIISWHETCNWYFRQLKHEFISAPSADRIIAAVYGEPKGEGYAKIKKQARECMLNHVVCGEPLDRGWISAAVLRISQPFSYNKKDGGWDSWRWEQAQNVACAIIRKYYYDKKEVFALEIDKNCNDRSYLYGRLLAIADRLESHARYIQKADSVTDKRPTNAVRYMSAFASKPLRSWKLIYGQLNPYIQRLDGAEWYQKQIDEIMSLFLPGDIDDKNDTQLNGKYLLGYSLQRRDIWNRNKTIKEIQDESDEEN